MLKRRIGTAFVIIGAVLMLSALLLVAYNALESRKAGEAAFNALSSLQAAMETQSPDSSLGQDKNDDMQGSDADQEEIPEPTDLTVVVIDGYGYIGYIDIPAFELKLPIMDDWSMERLQTAPCLQYGSPLTNDAVIAGHNYKHHFLPLHTIEVGEKVTFTDMTGYVIEYEVADVKTINPTSVSEVIDSEYDLILYTCTTGGQYRVTVRCNRVNQTVKTPEAKG